MRKGLVLMMLALACKWVDAQNLSDLEKRYRRIENRLDISIHQKIDILDSIVDLKMHTDPENTFVLLDTLAYLIATVGDSDRYYKVKYLYRGFLYASLENQYEAIYNYEKYGEHFRKETFDDAYFLIDLGNIYYDLQLFKSALRYYRDAETIFKKLNESRGLTTVYSNYSLIFDNTNQPDSAFYYIEKTLALQKDVVHDTLQMAHTHYVYGRLYQNHTDNIQAARMHFLNSIRLFSKPSIRKEPRYFQFIDFMFQSQTRHGRSFINENQDSALYYFNYVMENMPNVIHEGRTPRFYSAIGQSLVEMGYLDRGKVILLLGEAISEKYKNQVHLEECYTGMRNWAMKSGDDDVLIEYLGKQSAVDKIKADQYDYLLSINDKVLTKEKNKTISLQKKQLKGERLLRWAMIIMVILAVGGVILTSYYMVRIRKSRKLVQQIATSLEESNRTKEIMLSIIGHDVRSPMGTIMLTGSRMLNRPPQGLNKSLLTDIAGMVQAAKSAYFMLENLMQWVTLNKQPVDKKMVTFQIIDCIDSTIGSLELFCQERMVVISNRIQSAQIYTDKLLFEVIIRNILSNAIKFSTQCGRIVISSSIDNGQYSLLFKDDGPGFPTSVIEKPELLWNTVASKGHGLGLRIIADLCKSLELKVYLANHPEGGALVTLSLGKLESIQEQISQGDSNQIQEEKYTAEEIIIIENYINELKMCMVYETTELREILNRLESEPLTSRSGKKWLKELQSAIHSLDQAKFNIIIYGNQ